MGKQTILCVDDEIDNLDALERVFRAKFDVLRASSGAEGLSLLDQNPGRVAVIVTDQRMPGMTGVQFLETSIGRHPHCVRILLTGYTDMESIIAAVNKGQIYRYLNKPWDPVDLLNTVERAAQRFELERDLEKKTVALEAAFKELQVLDQSKTQFMMLVNHELKTPLTSMLSYTEMLKETRLDPEQTLFVDRIMKSAERLRSLIDDVLIVTSGEMGQIKPTIQPFVISEADLAWPDPVRQLMSKKRQSVKIQMDSLKLVGDRNILTQILGRLVHNAAKFSPEDAQIEITCKKSQSHRASFKVFNPGAFVPPAVIEKIAKPFFIDEEMLHHTTGTGLGLTVCQTYLKSLSSKLVIANRDQGVEASFELPYI